MIFFREGLEPVPAVSVHLSPGGNSTNSNASGAYSFASLAEQTWTILPLMPADVSDCVDVDDGRDALDLAVKRTELDDQMLLAADVSGDGQVTAYDAALILQYGARILPELPVAATCGTNWLFIPDALALPDQTLRPPVVSENSCTHGSIELAPLSGDTNNRNFRAVLIGDVNGSWTAP